MEEEKRGNPTWDFIIILKSLSGPLNLETAAIRANRIVASRMDKERSPTEWDKLGRILMVRLEADGHPINSWHIFAKLG